VDKVDIRSLREAAALAARLALRVASSSDWPVTQRSVSDVQALLDRPEYREERRFREALDAHYAEARQV
jgi:hypothetical protein